MAHYMLKANRLAFAGKKSECDKFLKNLFKEELSEEVDDPFDDFERLDFGK